MKLTMTGAHFRAATDWCGRRIPVRTSAPILGAVRIEAQALADRDRVHILSCDGTNWASVCRLITLVAPGAVAVSGRALHAVGQALDRAAFVTLEEEPGHLRITAGRLDARLRLMPVEDYPPAPALPLATVELIDGVEYTVGQTFSDMALYAGHLEQHTADLHPCELTFGPDFLEVAATDRYRLLHVRIPYTGPGVTEERSVNVPYGAVRAFADAAKGNGAFRLSVPTPADTMITLETMGRQLAVQLGAGKAPSWRKMLGLKYDAERWVQVETGRVLSILKALAPMAEKNEGHAQHVVMRIESDTLTLVADDEAGKAAITLDCGTGPAYSDDPWWLTFNAKYLIDGLTAVHADQVCLALSSPLRPVRIAPVSSDNAVQTIIMPVRSPQ